MIFFFLFVFYDKILNVDNWEVKSMLSGLLGAMIGFVVFMLIFVIAIYVVEGIFLTKLNKLMYGKGTALAWIPIANSYLLGKLTVNNIVGWTLVICTFLTMNFSTTINGIKKTTSILPYSIRNTVSNILSIVQLGLLVYAIIKYFKLKKEGIVSSSNNEHNVNSTDISTIENNFEVNSNLNEQIDRNEVNVDNENVVTNTLETEVSNRELIDIPFISSGEKVILEDVPVMPELGEVYISLEKNENILISQSMNPNDVPVLDEEVPTINQQSSTINNDQIEIIEIFDVETKENMLNESLTNLEEQEVIESLQLETMNVDIKNN